jgi:transposase
MWQLPMMPLTMWPDCVWSIPRKGLLITALLEAGAVLYPVNPKTVDHKRTASGARTDLIDAYLRAMYGCSEFADLRRREPDSPQSAECKAVTRGQDTLIQRQTHLGNQFTACLKASNPVALQLFSQWQQRRALVFLPTYPAPASPAALEATLRKGGHTNRVKVAPGILATLQQPRLQADSLTLALVEQLLPLIKRIAEYDKASTDLFLTLAEWGDDRRCAQTRSIQVLTGTCPVPWKSGAYAPVHMRFACLKPLR